MSSLALMLADYHKSYAAAPDMNACLHDVLIRAAGRAPGVIAYLPGSCLPRQAGLTSPEPGGIVGNSGDFLQAEISHKTGACEEA